QQVRRGAQHLHARRPFDGGGSLPRRRARGRGADGERAGGGDHHHRRRGRTANGPVAATITIGGVAAPRHARTVAEILAHAQESLDSAKAKRRGSFVAYRPNIERETLRQENVRATDKIITALNERRILLAFEPLVAATTRELAFYECLMRIRRADGSVVPATAVIPIAEQLGLVRLIDHRVIE